MSGEHSREAVAEIISLNVKYIKYLALREICNIFWISDAHDSGTVEDLTDQFMGGEINIEEFKSKIKAISIQLMQNTGSKTNLVELEDSSLGPGLFDQRSRIDELGRAIRIRRLESLFRILERQDL